MPPINLQVTQFEKLILKLSSIGVTSHEIAEKLCVSEEEVNAHKKKIREKLHAKNDSQANFFAKTFGLIPN
jgi:DNA-binding NarL/FixJ family response regulator